MKIILFGSFITAMLSGMFLFHVKYQVLALERDQACITTQYVKLQEDIATLHSHWCYLTRPERVEALIRQNWPNWVQLSPSCVMHWPTFLCAVDNAK